MKILISFLVVLNIYTYALEGFDSNMDKKVYYDANRDTQKGFEKLSSELDLFIKNKADDDLIELFKNGKLKDSELLVNTNENKKIQKKKEPTFFDKILEKVGLGSTKTIEEDIPIIELNTTIEDINTQEQTNEN
jgi:hypothetical protein